MLLNAYETTVGKPFAIMDKVQGVLKSLATMDDLDHSSKEGVYFITYENGSRLPLFIFPLSLLDHQRRKITVVDKRPFSNKKDIIISPVEFIGQFTAACIQQDAFEGNLNTIKNSRYLTTRGYAKSLSNRIGRQSGLDPREMIELAIILGHFFVCLTEKQNDDYQFVSANVLKNALQLDQSMTQPIIEEMGFISTIPELTKYISDRPGFFKLKNFTQKDFIGLGSNIIFSNLGKQVVGAALEHPPLFTGLCFMALKNRMYLQTVLGQQIDPKYNERLTDSFVKMINGNYPVQL